VYEYIVYGVWRMVYGVWCMAYGVWRMAYDVSPVPVMGRAMTSKPTIIHAAAIILPATDVGYRSPYPTLSIVTNAAQHEWMTWVGSNECIM
jgi:hypothetical protein